MTYARARVVSDVAVRGASARRMVVSTLSVLLASTLAPHLLHAQARTTDTTRAAQPPATVAQPVGPPPVAAQAAADTVTPFLVKPPLTPKRAFIYSALLPGFGQSRLDRGSSGALFASVELTALVMLRRVGMDLREARTYRADTLFSEFDPTGDGRGIGVIEGRYNADLIRTRRLHVEDWLAVLAFNHLFAGADAFVSAQLYDMPVQLSAVPGPRGPWFVASLRF